MSWVLVAVIALFLLFGFIGYNKGVVKIVLSMAILFVTLFVSVFVTPVISKTIKNNTGLYDGLEDAVYSVITKNKVVSEEADDSISEYEENISKEQIADKIDTISKYTGSMLEGLKLPENITSEITSAIMGDNITKLLSDNSIDRIFAKSDGTVAGAASAIAVVKLTEIIFNAIIYVFVFAIMFVLLRVLAGVTGIITRLPVIKQANRLGGLLLGLAEGLLAVWIMFIVVTAFGSVEWASDALSEIGGNSFLSFLYDSNIFLKMIFK